MVEIINKIRNMTPEFIEVQKKIAREKLVTPWDYYNDAPGTERFIEEKDLDTIIEATILATEREMVKRVEELPAFTCCSDKCMGKVSDEAKKPMYGTNYLERETVIKTLTPK
jgi:hypothetical protein